MKKRQMTLIEIMLVSSIIVFLGAILFAVVDSAKEQGAYARWQGAKEQKSVDPSCLAYYIFDEAYSETKTETKYTPARKVKVFKNLANYAGSSVGWNKDTTGMKVIDSNGDGKHDNLTYTEGAGRFKKLGGIKGKGTGVLGKVVNRSLTPKTALTLSTWIRLTNVSGTKKILGRFMSKTFGSESVFSGYELSTEGEKIKFKVAFKNPNVKVVSGGGSGGGGGVGDDDGDDDDHAGDDDDHAGDDDGDDDDHAGDDDGDDDDHAGDDDGDDDAGSLSSGSDDDDDDDHADDDHGDDDDDHGDDDHSDGGDDGDDGSGTTDTGTNYKTYINSSTYGYASLSTGNILGTYVNKWINITTTFNGKKLSIYVEGVLRASKTWTTFNMSNMGSYPLEVGKNFDGYMSELSIFDRTLSSEEISTSFQAETPRDRDSL